jgi:hypothetical protein
VIDFSGQRRHVRVTRTRRQDVGLLQQTRDSVGRLRADGQPVRDSFSVETQVLGAVSVNQRIVSANVLDELAVTSASRISHLNQENNDQQTQMNTETKQSIKHNQHTMIR